MKKKHTESVWELFHERTRAEEAFESESDRAVSLITAAFLDDGLEALLRKCLVERHNLVNELFSYNGPFGTFSARINTAYALGHISETTFKDLNIIRGIRNDFAHSRKEISFDTPSIRGRAMNLSFPMITAGSETPDFDSPRVKYIEITSWTLNKIQAREREIESPKWPENKA
jgi:DNA-binding MltR family transcriptional regulator